MSEDNEISLQEESSGSEASSLSEDAGRISRRKENEFLATLVRIRAGDRGALKEDHQILSSSEEESVEPGGKDGNQESSPLYLRDVQAARLLSEGASVFSTSDEEEGDSEDDKPHSKRMRLLGYNKEQQDLRAQFVGAAHGSDDESSGGEFGGLQKAKEKNMSENEEEVAKTEALVNQIFNEGSSKLTADDKFLKDFIVNQQWVESESEESGDSGGGPSLNEDEEFLEKADNFEATYNFRFEEPGSSKIVNYPRFVETSIRKKESKRKRQREKKLVREAEKQHQSLQNIKTMKNVKKKEIKDKFAGISAAAGGALPAEDLINDLMNGDFEIDEWDKKMLAAYGDDYYDQQDQEWATEEAGNDTLPEMHDEPQQREAQEDTKIKEAQQEIASKGRAELQNLIKEYYELDEEDNIDGIKCRFKYVKVPKDTYGLTAEELICLDDKDLNTFVGTRRLDPYRDDTATYKVNPYKLKEIRHKVDFSKMRGRGAGRASKPSKVDLTQKVQHSKKWPKTGEGLDSKLKEASKAEDKPVTNRLASYSRETLQPKKKLMKRGKGLRGRNGKMSATTSQQIGPKQQRSEKKNRARRNARKNKDEGEKSQVAV